MHEMGITQGILAAAFDAAEEAGATRITQISISVGEMTEVVDFALQFAFEALTPGTMAEGATLNITAIPARSRCRTCDLTYDHDRFQMICPHCDSLDIEQLQGRDLRIDSIEADTPDGIITNELDTPDAEEA